MRVAAYDRNLPARAGRRHRPHPRHPDEPRRRGLAVGVDVLSVAAVARYVAQAVVLGFDLVSAKPTLIINLPQAKKQNVLDRCRQGCSTS